MHPLCIQVHFPWRALPARLRTSKGAWPARPVWLVSFLSTWQPVGNPHAWIVQQEQNHQQQAEPKQTACASRVTRDPMAVHAQYVLWENTRSWQERMPALIVQWIHQLLRGARSKRRASVLQVHQGRLVAMPVCRVKRASSKMRRGPTVAPIVQQTQFHQ